LKTVTLLKSQEVWPVFESAAPPDNGLSQDTFLETTAAAQEYPSKQFNTFSADARQFVRALANVWPHHPVSTAYGQDTPAVVESQLQHSSPNPSGQGAPDRGEKQPGGEPGEGERIWVRTAEDFVAIQTIVFLSQFFIQLRYLALGIIWPSVLLLLA